MAKRPVATANNIPCPFCGLLCDDLEIDVTGDTLRPRNTDCPRAIDGFGRSVVEDSPRIDGEPASLEEAVRHAARLVRKARQPLIAGLGTDVAGARAALALADACGGVVDHAAGEGLMRNFLTLQDRGWFMTTLSEVRNRAELVIFAGTDASRYPRFFERCIWNPDAMFEPAPASREVVFIGKGLRTSAGVSPDGRRPEVIRCERERIGEVMAVLRALLLGKPVQAGKVAGASLSRLQDLARRMRETRYGVLVWSPADLDFPHADLTVQAMAELVKELNETTRFGGLSLGGDEGAMTAAQVCAWQSGYPLRTGFAGGRPDYDHTRYATARMLADGDADLLLWVSSFNPDSLPPQSNCPQVLIGLPGMKPPREPEVFIPVATPGVDHGGQLVRCDSVVTLRLRQVRSPAHPTASQVLEQIQQAL